MSPKSYFDNVWRRADLFNLLYSYIKNNTASALDPTELLRAEWAMRVSALDLYIHELIAQNLLKVFQGTRSICPGYLKFKINVETLMRIQSVGPGSSSDAAFEFAVREALSRITYQFPDDIADGVRLISTVELWNEIAKYKGATGGAVQQVSKDIRGSLSQIVSRRNKIVHEGDLQPGVPRVEWPIDGQDLSEVKMLIGEIVNAIDSIVK